MKNLFFMGYPNYHITENGEIFNKNMKPLKYIINEKGYARVKLSHLNAGK